MANLTGIEYELRDYSSSPQDVVEIFWGMYSQPGVFDVVVILDSVFLRNRKKYQFGPGETEYWIRDEGVLRDHRDQLCDSSFGKGHMSVLYGFSDPNFINGYLQNVSYKKVGEQPLGTRDCGPLRNDQQLGFRAAVYSVFKGKCKFACVFSHDAEFFYVLDA